MMYGNVIVTPDLKNLRDAVTREALEKAQQFRTTNPLDELFIKVRRPNRAAEDTATTVAPTERKSIAALLKCPSLGLYGDGGGQHAVVGSPRASAARWHEVSRGWPLCPG